MVDRSDRQADRRGRRAPAPLLTESHRRERVAGGVLRNCASLEARRASLNWQGSGLEIHRAARPLGVRIPRPPPLNQLLAPALPADLKGPRSLGVRQERAARFSCGAISLSIAAHLPVMPFSYSSKPVRLPPGRARLATNPDPTGSETCANTIGIVRLWRCSAAVSTCEPRPLFTGDQRTIRP
jgi:hypothetical protein